MKWFNCVKVRLVLVGVVAAIVLGGGSAKADFTFGEPTNLGPVVNSSFSDGGPSLSADGLSLYFSSDRDGGSGDSDIWMTTRETIDSEWSTPVNLGPTINSAATDIEPDISANGLELYFESWHRWNPRPGNVNWMGDIWVAKRANIDDPWGTPVNLVPLVSTTEADGEPSISSDGLELYYVTGPVGDDTNIYVSIRENISTDWGAPQSLDQLNPQGMEWSPDISSDGRVLFFGRTDDWTTPCDIWMAIRDSVSGDWNPPIKLGPPINIDSSQCGTTTSADGRFLLFDSDRSGGHGDYDIWQATIDPVVDLNGDGIVDVGDVCIMVDYWGTDDSLCDIGPMPWGDGVVDVQDLIVLAGSFTDFIIVDDFEVYYNDFVWPEPDSGDLFAFYTWIDGYGIEANGSNITYFDPSLLPMEETIVHGGAQSVPYFYNNNLKNSEAIAYVASLPAGIDPATYSPLPISPDWTEEGVGVLSLWFHGKADNDAEPMYVALNGVAVYHDNANATQVTEWEEWTIPLQEFADLGVDLTDVNSITIGFGIQDDITTAGGSGMVLFDDIRLY